MSFLHKFNVIYDGYSLYTKQFYKKRASLLFLQGLLQHASSLTNEHSAQENESPVVYFAVSGLMPAAGIIV